MSSEAAPRVLDLREDRQIEHLLRRDRGWAAYALSDLEPPYREHSRFVGAVRDGLVDAVVLLFRTPEFTSLLPFGNGRGVDAILEHLTDLPNQLFVAFGEEHESVLRRRFRLDVWTMYRMVTTPAMLSAPATVETRRLSPTDLSAVEELYCHWDSTFFQPMLLSTGIYRGVYVDGRLVAIAGTHTRSSRYRLGTIGGIFTHPEYRGRGFATALTAAVAHDLVREGADLIVLNVRQNNEPALSIYRRLGFTALRPYVEGHAVLR